MTSRLTPRQRTALIVIGIVIVSRLISAWMDKQSQAPPANGQVASNSPVEPQPEILNSDEFVDPDEFLFGDQTAEEEPRSAVAEVTQETAQESSGQNPPSGNSSTSESEKSEPPSNEPSEPALGELKKISRTVYESTAGVRYGSGSEDGHRLTHLMQHADDDLDKPVHGVFTGTKRGILVLIDEAWLTAQKRGPPQVKKEQQRDRTIYTIDMKKKIGYVGGQRGARQDNPPCYKIRLVMEGSDLITAYPVE